PILSLKSQNPDGSEFVIKEMELGVEVSEMWKSGEMEAEIAKFSGDSSVEVQIGSPSSQFKKEIQMPFIDVTKDVLSEVKFTDGTEIILSCC
ncbi:MAG: hypothetical protein GY754_17175, partial [bacterium]|nr:hypothetical protein [bacterium]